MTPENCQRFLAKRGLILSLNDVKKVVHEFNHLRTIIRQTVKARPDYYENWKTLDKNGRLKIVRALNNSGIETTPDEFDHISELILMLYDEIFRKY